MKAYQWPKKMLEIMREAIARANAEEQRFQKARMGGGGERGDVMCLWVHTRLSERSSLHHHVPTSALCISVPMFYSQPACNMYQLTSPHAPQASHSHCIPCPSLPRPHMPRMTLTLPASHTHPPSLCPRRT